MKVSILATVLALSLTTVDSSMAGHRDGSCSARSLVGRWIFATDVGQFPAFGGDITALGTFSVDREGNSSGEFDATIAGVDFLPDIPFEGSMTLNSDCTGTSTFVTGVGTARTDSIALVGDGELRGMSQDPGNLWTYRAWRISKRPPR